MHGWWKDDESESNHQCELEWMADKHIQWKVDRIDPPAATDDLPPVASSSKRSVESESSGSGSCTALVDVHADSSSEGDSYSSSSESEL